MTAWTMLLCEGAHDQAALASLARICGQWEDQKRAPAFLAATESNPPTGGADDPRFRGFPKYLRKGESHLVIHPLGGAESVLGDMAINLLRHHGKREYPPRAVGVMVDADDEGVDNRATAFRNRYKDLYEHAGNVKPGVVSEGKPWLGLWIAPDNKAAGSMDDLLLKAASRSKTKLIATGRRFATSLAKIEPGTWTHHRNKAILGAVNQVVLPGASLASALSKSKCWFDQTTTKVLPLKRLLQFIETLTAP